MACIRAKPIVDGIEQNIKDKAYVIRLDLQSEVGQLYAARYTTNSTPTFIMLDKQGKLAWVSIGKIEDYRVYEVVNK